MNRLMGLPEQYCSASEIISQILPPLETDQSPFSNIIHLLKNSRNPSLKILYKQISLFLESCRNIKTSEYKTFTKNIHQDKNDVWLPLLVLGREWPTVYQLIFEFNTENWHKFNNLDFLYFEPGSFASGYKATIHLHNSFNLQSSGNYTEFEDIVKNQFSLQTSFNPDTMILTVLNSKSQKLQANPADSEMLVLDQIPQWIIFLLKFDAIKHMNFSYPIPNTTNLLRYISSSLVFPNFSFLHSSTEPTNFKQPSDTFVSFFDNVSSKLGVSSHNFFYTIVSDSAEEWLEIINRIIKTKVEFYFIEENDRSLSYEKDSIQNKFLISVLKRSIILNPNLVLRKDYDLKYCDILYNLDSKDSENCFYLIPSFRLALDESLSFSVIKKIASKAYLKDVLSLMHLKGELLLSNLNDDLANNENDIPSEAIGEDNLQCNTSKLSKNNKSFFSYASKVFTLLPDSHKAGNIIQSENSFYNSDIPANVFIEALYLFLKSYIFTFISNINTSFSFLDLLIKDKRPDLVKFSLYPDIEETFTESDHFNLILYIFKILLSSNFLESRKHALACLLYLLDDNDVIPDFEPDGLNDDFYCIAMFFKKLQDIGEDVPTKLREWSQTFFFDADARLHSFEQSCVRNQIAKKIRTLDLVLKFNG